MFEFLATVCAMRRRKRTYKNSPINADRITMETASNGTYVSDGKPPPLPQQLQDNFPFVGEWRRGR
jgi:hypothetical protein